MTTVSDVTPSEVALKDRHLETASVLRKYLEIVNGRTLHATRPCKSTAMELPLRLAEKYGDLVAQQTLLFIITNHLDLNCHHCTPAKALSLGGRFGSDMLIRKAMGKLVAKEKSVKASVMQHFHSTAYQKPLTQQTCSQRSRLPRLWRHL